MFFMFLIFILFIFIFNFEVRKPRQKEGGGLPEVTGRAGHDLEG